MTTIVRDLSPSPANTAVFGVPPDLWSTYSVCLAFRSKLIGGIPKDPALIEGWLRTKGGIEDPSLLHSAVARTLDEVSHDGVDAAELLTRRTVGFKRGEDGLYVEGRQVKAMLKESTNVVFAGERWGPTRKACRAFFAERVFIDPDRISVDAAQPDGLETVVGHISGPAGPHSTLTQYEYVMQPLLTFRVLVLHDSVHPEQWRAIWSHAQENGFGTLRSQGHGRFDVVHWERIDELDLGTGPPGLR